MIDMTLAHHSLQVADANLHLIKVVDICFVFLYVEYSQVEGHGLPAERSVHQYCRGVAPWLQALQSVAVGFIQLVAGAIRHHSQHTMWY